MPTRDSLPAPLRARSRSLGFALLLAAGATPVAAQNPRPSPTPIPPILSQDENELQSRSSVILGSGARALGMGGAFLARADDASAASWNPAGLSYLRRPELTLVGAKTVFNSETEAGDRNRFEGTSPDFGAFTFPLTFKNAGGAVQLSYQRVIPFQGNRQISRISGTLAQEVTIDSTGGFDVVALGTGWKLTNKLRFGLTLNRWVRGYDQDLRRAVENGRTREITTSWDMQGWNTNLGLIFSPGESLNLAVVGKTPFTADVQLAKSRTDFLPGGGTSQNAYASDDVRLDFPGAVGFGASWRPESRLTLSADYTRTFWSDAYVYNYFVIPIRDSGGSDVVTPPPEDVYPKLPYPYVNQSTQSDSVQIRAGFEFVFISGRLKVPIRGGYFNDRQIRIDADGHAPRYNGFAGGMGLIVGPVLLDAAYLYEHGSYVDSVVQTRVTQTTHQFLASVIYRFGGNP